MSSRGRPPERRAVADRIARAIPALDTADVERLACHLALLLAWNQRFALTAITDLDEAIRRHVAEGLAAAAVIRPAKDDLVVDLGSGNGYPAVPLLTVWRETAGLLVEARETKAAFLRAVLRETGLASRVGVRHARLSGPEAIDEAATVVTLRAFPEPGRWVAGALRRPNVRCVLAWLAQDDAQAIARSLAAAELVPLATGSLLVARSVAGSERT